MNDYKYKILMDDMEVTDTLYYERELTKKDIERELYQFSDKNLVPYAGLRMVRVKP